LKPLLLLSPRPTQWALRRTKYSWHLLPIGISGMKRTPQAMPGAAYGKKLSNKKPEPSSGKISNYNQRPAKVGQFLLMELKKIKLPSEDFSVKMFAPLESITIRKDWEGRGYTIETRPHNNSQKAFFSREEIIKKIQDLLSKGWQYYN
jgi:hypothetical protein